jgi:hypothetical protein
VVRRFPLLTLCAMLGGMSLLAGASWLVSFAEPLGTFLGFLGLASITLAVIGFFLWVTLVVVLRLLR